MYIQNIQGQSESWERVEMCWSQYWVCPYLPPYLLGISVPNMLSWVRTWIEICRDIPRWGLTGKTTSRSSYLFPWLLYLLVSTHCPHINTCPAAPGNHTGHWCWQVAWSLNKTFFSLDWLVQGTGEFSPSNYPGCYSWLTDKLKSWFPPLLKTSLC